MNLIHSHKRNVRYLKAPKEWKISLPSHYLGSLSPSSPPAGEYQVLPASENTRDPRPAREITRRRDGGLLLGSIGWWCEGCRYICGRECGRGTLVCMWEKGAGMLVSGRREGEVLVKEGEV